MKKISILSIIISILSLTNCSNPEKEEQKFVFKTLFEGIENSRPEILTKKEINLDDSKENEKIFIIRNIQEEV
ncbi:MAG: hypothetical protein KDK36_17685, partial [Leptospiraceae bacterium]|nr:hypothetical protein [Leptospiraceae bacterium]